MYGVTNAYLFLLSKIYIINGKAELYFFLGFKLTLYLSNTIKVKIIYDLCMKVEAGFNIENQTFMYLW